MSHLFTLQPNLTMLDKYGYEYLSELDIDAIQTTKRRLNIEKKFRDLLKRSKIDEHYDTILYISLVESNNARLKENYRHHNYDQLNLVKEPAQLLLIINPQEKHQPLNIKVSSLVNSVKLTDERLIKRIIRTLHDAIEIDEFNKPMLSEMIYDMTSDEHGEILAGEQRLNYDKIKYYANATIRKPGVRERNRYLTSFLFQVWNYIDGETIGPDVDNLQIDANTTVSGRPDLYQEVNADN